MTPPDTTKHDFAKTNAAEVFFINYGGFASRRHYFNSKKAESGIAAVR